MHGISPLALGGYVRPSTESILPKPPGAVLIRQTALRKSANTSRAIVAVDRMVLRPRLSVLLPMNPERGAHKPDGEQQAATTHGPIFSQPPPRSKGLQKLSDKKKRAYIWAHCMRVPWMLAGADGSPRS